MTERDPPIAPELALREATSADTRALVDLINEAYVVEASIVSGARTDEPEIRDKLSGGRFVVAEKEGRVLGCVYLEVDPPTSYWGLLAVHPAEQGTGLGRRLMRHAEDEVRRAGAREATILVINLRRNLRGWYRGLGYSEAGTRPFEAPERQIQPCHFVVMKKKLC